MRAMLGKKAVLEGAHVAPVVCGTREPVRITTASSSNV